MRKIILTAIVLFAATSNVFAEDEDSLYAKDLLASGMDAPEFVLKTNDGNSVSLKDNKGKYVILDFWASWCPDCRKDIPGVKAIYDKYKDCNVSVVGISFDTDATAWNNCIEKNGMAWTQASELKKWKKGTEIDKKYRINWIPTLYLIGPDGKVILGTVVLDKMNKTLDKLVKDGKIK